MGTGRSRIRSVKFGGEPDSDPDP